MESDKIWIIDTDYSYDDAVILPFLLKHLNVAAITTVGHNNICPAAVKKVIVEEIDFPAEKVFTGSTQPFVDYTEHANDKKNELCYYTESHLDNLLKNSEGAVPQKNQAVWAILRLIKEHKKNLSILTLGPLTNIAMALMIEADFSSKFDRLFVTGGSLENYGNGGSCGEFHFTADPVAACSVFEGCSNITLIPLEVERKLLKSIKEVSDSTPAGKAFGEVLKKDKEGLFLLGLFSAAVAVSEDCVTEEFEAGIKIDILGRYTRGSLIYAKYPYVEAQNEKKTRIISEIDPKKVKELLFA